MGQIDFEQERARKLVGAIVQSTGLSATEIARKAGLSPSTLTRIYPRPSVSYTLSTRTLAKLRSAFPQSFAAYNADEVLLTGAFPISSARQLHEVNDQRQPYTAQSVINLPMYRLAPLDITGVDHGLTISPDFEFYGGNFETPSSQIAAPMRISDPDRFFGAYVPGDSMEPRFRAGEIIIIDKLKPAGLRADVLVKMQIPRQEAITTVAELIGRDRNVITLRQHRYSAEATFHRSAVIDIFPIVALFEDDL